MPILSKLLGSGLGLASEAVHAARSRSRSRSDQAPVDASSNTAAPIEEAGRNHISEASRNPSRHGHPADAVSDDEVDSDAEDRQALGQDEAAWELDEMATQLYPPTYEQSQAAAGAESEDVKVRREEEMVRELVRKAGPPPHPIRRIPCPVILPQRRPRNKGRGFVRAYAPVLADCGISQEVFLEFLEKWDKASEASGWIEIVLVAATIAGVVPEMITQIVSTAVQVVAGAALELQTRSRRNNFLDRVNQDLLMPRGLFAMIMAFKDDIPNQSSAPLYGLASSVGKSLYSTQRLDLNQTVAKYSNPDPEMSKLKRGMQNIRLASGETRGDIELPEAAELIFPDLDRVAETALTDDGAAQAKEKGTFDKFKKAGNWVQDYLDRRGQAFYENEHQGSSLAVPSANREQLVSRYNDPNHPANSGSLIALLTGGAVSPTPRREARQARRDGIRESRDARRVARGRPARGPRRVGRRGSRKTIFKKIMHKDVLYLMVVNLPTEEEVQGSVARLEQMIRERDSGALG
ncbi:hypothetical protein PDE_04181 [Penicillium oxalicum 114-2]|uniref:Uncharacterized protein n=1 Tax=Penicillium oxalicum (strain 114-2 / CGMCC 5302) TaxID=933388 RepID=S8B3Y0_PENO1|nr:hypothetical protein PDE_04181 [Penicillium oxalicum 114-2]